MSPPPSTFVNSGDSILLLRPNGSHNNEYGPSAQPVEVDLGDWRASAYERSEIDEYPLGKDSAYRPETAMSGRRVSTVASFKIHIVYLSKGLQQSVIRFMACFEFVIDRFISFLALSSDRTKDLHIPEHMCSKALPSHD